MVQEQTKLRTAARVENMLSHVEYRLATSPEDKLAIYRLRYRAYLNEGAILANPDEITTDRFDEHPSTFVFGVYVDNELASSIRVSVASAAVPTSPSVDVFPDVLKAELDAGKVIVDPTRFVADPVRARNLPELPYITVRLGYLACGYFDADIGLATVRAEHRAFYRRVFLQESLCEPRMFPGLVKPVGLTAADYHATCERVFTRFPFMRSSAFERRMLFGRPGALPERPEHVVEPTTIVPAA